MIFINALTGHGLGERTPSMKRASLFSSFFGALAALLLISGLVLGFIAQDLTRYFSLVAFGVLLLLVPLIMILFVIYERGRPDQFRQF
jgi:hypothetical protein